MVIEARLIKVQGQKLVFNLKIQKAKLSATASYLDFSLKWQSHLLESHKETAFESCLTPYYISL